MWIATSQKDNSIGSVQYSNLCGNVQEHFGGNYEYIRNPCPLGNVCDVQQWNVEAVKCINEWANGFDGCQCNDKNQGLTEWLTDLLTACMHHWMILNDIEWVHERRNEPTTKSTNEWINGWMNEWTSERTWVSEWVSEWMNEWKNEWVNHWKDEWSNESTNLIFQECPDTLGLRTFWNANRALLQSRALFLGIEAHTLLSRPQDPPYL